MEYFTHAHKNAGSVAQFKKLLKTHFFTDAFLLYLFTVSILEGPWF